MSKRKVTNSEDMNDRDKKKQKQTDSDRARIDWQTVPMDCRREIMLYIADIDMFKSMRISRQWKEEAQAEINSRFANKYLLRLKAMSAPSSTLKEAEISSIIDRVDEEIKLAESEILAMKSQVAKLGKMKMAASTAKTLSIKERFNLWSNPKIPKKTYTTPIPIQPPGEDNVWDILGYDNLRHNEQTLDGLCDFLYDYLWHHSNDEAEAEARYDAYLQVLMDLDFGRYVRS